MRDGRYGPYVNWGKVNATLPKGKDPASVTLEEALPLLAERAAKSGVKTPKKAAAKTSKAKTTKAKAAEADGEVKPAKATKAKTAGKSAASKTSGAKTTAKPAAAKKTAAKAKKD